MERIPESSRAAMLDRIRQSLGKAQVRAEKLRRTNARLIWLSLATSALATVLAGVTAAAGPLVGQGPPAWRLTCGAVAVLTALAGVLSGAHQKLNVAERLAGATACAGRLQSLELALTVTGRDVVDVAGDYEQVVAGYREYVF